MRAFGVDGEWRGPSLTLSQITSQWKAEGSSILPSKFCRALTLIKILARTLSSLSWATCVKPLTAYWRYHRYVTTFRIIDRRRCSSNPVTNNKKPNRNPNRNPNPNPTTIPAPPSTTILTPKGFQIHFGHWSFHIFQNDFIAIWYETMASFCFHRRSFTR